MPPHDDSTATTLAPGVAEHTGDTGSPTVQFDPDSTVAYQARIKKAPVWFASFLASNSREKRRLHSELAAMRGAWRMLLKQRRGRHQWTPEDKDQLKAMLRSASSVSPYLFIWALPGSMLLLPFLAWHLDRRRRRRDRVAPPLRVD